MRNYSKKGSIGITIVMLVFCLLMSVSMSYQKTIQSETLVQNNVNYSDRAIDAAFSGINYAMAVIQSNKKVFADTGYVDVLFTKDGDESNEDIHKSLWINLASTATFESYLDEDRSTAKQKLPPYRFKISCTGNSYNRTGAKSYVLVKSYGEYIKYDENNNIVNKYAAQLMAECTIDKAMKTINLNRYRRMQLQDPDAATTNFFSFTTGNFNMDY